MALKPYDTALAQIALATLRSELAAGSGRQDIAEEQARIALRLLPTAMQNPNTDQKREAVAYVGLARQYGGMT